MEMIALLPGLVAIAVCLMRSPATAFLNVYLPVLLLIPDHFRWRVPGLPDPSLQHTAILAIALLLPFLRHARWLPSLTDLLVLGYASVIGYSEYRAAGWWDAQNLLLDQLCTVVLPYALARLLIQPGGLGPAFARRCTLLLAVVAVLSLWEFRMGTRLFFENLWGSFFPGQMQMPVQYRWLFARIGGPYTHAILAGMIFGVGLFLQAWLMHVRAWKTRLAGLAVLGAVLLGSVLTVSRGPWLGIVLGSCVAVLGFVKQRERTLVKIVLVALLVVPPAWQFAESYVGVASTQAGSHEQQTVTYRAELIDLYMPVVWRQPEFGYGTHRWPVNDYYQSLDNQYLLLALEHGVVAVAALVALIAWVLARLLVFAWLRPARSHDCSLAFTLMGAILCIAVAIGTAYLSAQVEPMLFMLLGWSEGLLIYGSVRRAGAAEPQAAGPPHVFRRVLS